MADNPTLEQYIDGYVSPHPSWAARALSANIQEPSKERIALGWAIEAPTHKYFNWHQNRTDKRLNVLEATSEYLMKYGIAGVPASTEKAPGVIAKAREDGTLSSSLLSSDAFSYMAMGNTSPVIGACIINPQGGSEFIVAHVDADGHQISPDKRYFDNHPTYKALRQVEVDGQVMVKHEKFYYKTLLIKDGEFAGKTARMLSPTRLEGYKVFPSFMKDGKEIDCWYCGAYSAVDLGGAIKKLGSVPGKMPFTNVNFPTMEQYCNNLNTGGVSGFGMWDWHQFTEIQTLFLIEHASFDSQAKCGYGRCSAGAATGTNFLANTVSAPDVSEATYRGHVGLWGNVWQAVRGIDVTTAGKLRVWNTDGSRAMVDTGYTVPAFNGTTCSRINTLKNEVGIGYDFNTMFIPATVVNTKVPMPNTNTRTVPNPHLGSIAEVFTGRYGTAGNGCHTGGAWNYGTFAGLFALSFFPAAPDAQPHNGTRISKV